MIPGHIKNARNPLYIKAFRGISWGGFRPGAVVGSSGMAWESLARLGVAGKYKRGKRAFLILPLRKKTDI